MSATHGKSTRDWRSWIGPLLSAGLLGGVLVVLHRELGQLHVHDLRAYLREIPEAHLLGAVLCTAASYLLLGGFDVLGLRYVGKHLPYHRTALSSFIAYAISNNAGAAALTGGAMRLRLYAAQNLTGTEVATLQGFCSLTNALGIMTLIGLSLLIAGDRAASTLHLLRPWSWLLGLLLLGAVTAYVLWSATASKGVEIFGWVLRPPEPLLAMSQTVLGAVELSVACAVLWWLLPPSTSIELPAFAGVYVLAVVAGIISHLPGGLGVFESIVLLAIPDAPRTELLAALLAYRAIYYFAPLLIAGATFAGVEAWTQRERLARVPSLVAAFVTPIAPQLVGALVVLAGGVLLISGATPAATLRLSTLRHLVPLPILEASHLVGSISGIGLLILARALFRRVREGYRLAVMLLSAGIVASLLKGLDYEEAGILAAVLAILWLGRKAFHRPASIMEERFTPAWIVGLSGVLGAVVWIGFFAHRHVQYTSDLWWTFAISADAPRMLRASLVSVLAAASFLALNLLRPARPQPAQPTRTDLERARIIIASTEDSLANAALSADKRLLFAPQDDAFIMYQVARRSWVALGDPVGPPARQEELIWRFRELADRHGGWTVFYQASAARLPLYIDFGLTPVKIGEEARVPLADFSLEGSERRELRQARARASRDGATFEVVDVDATEPLLPALRAISDAWLEEKATAEKGFSIGSFSDEYLRRFPIAVVRCAGAPVAFANLWGTASRAELSIDLMRFSADAPRGVMDYLFTELMLWGRAQGYAWFNLGMAPLAGLDPHPWAPAWNRLGSFVFLHGEHFYNFQGLRHYKEKFAPRWSPRYLVAPAGALVLPRVLFDVSTLIAGGTRELLSK